MIILGQIIDRYGKRAYLCIFSSFLMIITFILFYSITPIIPVILLGIGYSIFASVIWSTIPLIVQSEFCVLSMCLF